MPDAKQELEEKLRTYVGVQSARYVAHEPVNEAMIHHYCAVTGDRNPVYHDPEAAGRSVHGGIVAPPAMLDAWVMPGPDAPWLADRSAPPPNKEVELHRLLDSYGYTGVVGTNQEQTYHRSLKLGDRLTAEVVFESISEEKATPLGLGYFISTRWTFTDQDGDEVGVLTFRVMKFKPAQQPAPASDAGTPTKATRMRPPRGHDNAWWWDGVDRGVLLIQKCGGCGELRHPPRPMCGSCQSLEWTSIEASGKGALYSFTVLHHPKFPGFEYPVVCALVEIEEGTRLVSNVVGCDPDALEIGMPLQLSVEHVDEEMKLPLFRPAT
jgi:uncharacterized OB-fold protein/acyl dehydratase